VSLGLAEEHARRSAPVLVTLVAVVAVSAPTAYHVVRVHELEARGASVATTLADSLAREARRRPRLWRYDSGKIVSHLRARADLSVAVRVFDERGVRVASDGEPEGALKWTRRSIAEDAGEVWVGVPLTPVRETALGLLVPFGLLGLALSLVLRTLSWRALHAAEGRIGGLIGELEAQSEGLEREVAARTRDLRDAYEDLAERDARLRGLSSRAVQMQEAERRAIGRELHDGAGQVLTAIRINLQLLATGALEGDAAKEKAVATQQLVDDALEEVRRALALLGPGVVAELGLARALEQLGADVAEAAGLEVEVDVRSVELPAALETTIYRVVQEALTNAVRHADAQEVRVQVEQSEGRVRVVVADDGIGMAADAAEGRGLSGMRARAELLGGEWRLDGASGGTRVEVALPVGPS